jgi:hypothetical protein
MKRSLGLALGLFFMALAPACSHERPPRDPLLAKYDATVAAAHAADAQALARGEHFLSNDTTATQPGTGSGGATHGAIGATMTTGAGLTRSGGDARSGASGGPESSGESQGQTGASQGPTGAQTSAPGPDATSGPGREVSPKSSLPATGQGTGNVSGPSPASGASGAGGHGGGAPGGGAPGGAGAGAGGGAGGGGAGSGGGAGGR